MAVSTVMLELCEYISGQETKEFTQEDWIAEIGENRFEDNFKWLSKLKKDDVKSKTYFTYVNEMRQPILKGE